MPIYFKVIEHVPPFEVLAHRIVWALPFGALIIASRRQWGDVWRAVQAPRTRYFLTLSAVLIAANWFTYIVAVQQDQVFQASLGYYINPLMNVAVGMMFLGERLRRLQLVAVALAALGVAVLTVSGGEVPWIALVLAVSFTIYGVLRKQVDVGAMPGLFVESSLLFPFALCYLVWSLVSGTAVFGTGTAASDALIAIGGPLTVTPLLLFAIAARQLPLSTVGIMQFLAPTLQFLIGVYYGEALTVPHIICFAAIWTAILIFVWDAWRAYRPYRSAPSSA